MCFSFPFIFFLVKECKESFSRVLSRYRVEHTDMYILGNKLKKCVAKRLGLVFLYFFALVK